MAGAVGGAVRRKSNPVQLGYVDEQVTDKLKDQVDFSTSKIGGQPDWISGSPSDVCCPLCLSPLRLVVQIYAPLENSVYHRTLYIMACLQPPCWNKAESWKCFRGQKMDPHTASAQQTMVTTSAVVGKTSDWLVDADDWGSDDNDDDDGLAEEDPNGNFPASFDKLSLDQSSPTICRQSSTSSSEMSPMVDDPNANQPESSGATGGCFDYSGQVATAEIETDSDLELKDLVAAESPPPLHDLVSEGRSNFPDFIQNQSANNSASNYLAAYFLAVDEEDLYEQGSALDDHERDLLQDYTLKEDLPDDQALAGKPGSGSSDVYEKALPKHGDVWFYKFVSVVQKNPGQVLRYSRDASHQPIFMTKPDLGVIPRQCRHCQGQLVCEVQILPSMIPSLAFEGGDQGIAPLEFGTVMVYTCLKSCWEPETTTHSLYKNEIIYLQAETL